MRQLAARLRRSLSGVRDLLTHYHRRGDVTPPPHGGGSPATLDATRRARVRTTVAHQPDATLQALCAASARPRRVPSAWRRCVEAWPHSGSPAKKPFRAAEQARPDIQPQRAACLGTRQGLAPAARVFLDATGSNWAMARDDARAPRGQRASATTPVNRGRRVTMLGALGLYGLVAAMTVDGGDVLQFL